MELKDQREYDASNVTQKLIHDAETAAAFVRAQIAKCMLRFLSCREMTIQQAALELGGISLVLAEFVDLKAPAKALNDWIAMVTGLCALLAQLCQCDSNQYHLVNNNGVYLLGKTLLLSVEDERLVDNQGWRSTQCSIFRVLRILFSLERNRGLFKKVFPIAFFEQFIDIGHYVQDLSAYRPLAIEYSKLIANTTASELQASWEGVNQKRAPIGRVAEYDLLDQLGAGAFGCVYTARKRGTVSSNGSPQYFALKEIFVVQLNVGDDKSFGDVISEVKIIKQQVRTFSVRSKWLRRLVAMLITHTDKQEHRDCKKHRDLPRSEAAFMSGVHVGVRARSRCYIASVLVTCPAGINGRGLCSS
ncbi:hypothetical protein TELCIR_01473 [Teladorsagia circumcincta]|uniref:Protein kinase domain-containing protein n=1 Tax=Teladorsagia circumcincta TaxID=45464 RepID=A0A2G9V1V9_TELCI|nr:hypothetical protein TELCIR_01473 [Teladorsagia circumcincta]